MNNSHLGIAILQSSVAGASNLFLTMGYLKTISKELDDAARIDGCSFVGTYFRVILPLSKPILATIALMAFRGSWNNYLMPRLMLADAEKSTLVVQVVHDPGVPLLQPLVHRRHYIRIGQRLSLFRIRNIQKCYVSERGSVI